MISLRNWLAAASLTLVFLGSARAQEPIRFARTPDISPDGKLVAFSYLGDIWTVEAIGGVARPVTMHQAHDISPAFSPDGRLLAFSSNRHGSYDVFVVPVHGGRPRRLTYDSAADVVCGWSPDGKQILFASTRSTDFPPRFELYTVPVEGGLEQRITRAEGKEGVYSPAGDRIAYVRGPGTWYRKGYRGSSNDEVWVCNADGTGNRRLTTFDGQDNSPMWSPDGRFVYYVSEYHGTPANIVRQDAEGKSPPQPVTFHKDDAVRRARISADGRWIVYECGCDLWVASTSEGLPPRKLAIEVHADDKSNTEVTETFTRGAAEFALNKDETHIAFVVHGEIFLQKLSSNARAVRLTNSPAYDHGVSWSPDSQKILFLSDRSGYEDIYLLESGDPDHPKLVEAHQFKVTRLTDTSDPEHGASFSPDGKRIAFLRAGKLWTMHPDGSNAKVLVNETQVFDYEWSPDSKWIAFARADGSFASELYIVPADGSEPPRNVTRHATYNGDVSWSADGKKLGFISQRRRGPGMFILALQKPAAAGAPAASGIDWDDIHLRAELAAPIPAEEGVISPDGNRVAFRSAGPTGDDLWVASTDGRLLTRVTTGNLRPTRLHWSRRHYDLIYFRDGQGQLRMVRPGTIASSDGRPAADSAVVIPFRVKMTIRRDEEFLEMFDQSWRALAEEFYDSKFHGVDWHAVRAKYRPVVRQVALKEDLYALISLMIGELNASHLGITGFLPQPEETTADLGLLFDDRYKGPGLKVAEVLKRGPADKRGLDLKPGDLILAINGVELSSPPAPSSLSAAERGEGGPPNLSRLLNDKVGEAVVLQVARPEADPRDPKARRRVEVQAASRIQIHALMYDRWVERNAARVSELSKGKLGYIHIPSMDEAGLDRFVRSLYSDNFDKEAIVLDVRYNSGGFTHDEVLNYLGAREHTIFRNRFGSEGTVLRSYDRKWTRPLVLLINNRSYSDAEILPNAFRTLGLGKLVGQPTGGHVIGTTSVRLIDGSIFRIPRLGVYTVSGVNLEREGVKPDVVVEEHPDELAGGRDVQLDKAVEVLQEEVAQWKKKNAANVARKPEEGKAPEPPLPVMPPGK
ncbi:MAG TPA: S41 family peptidase [Gemmataceae bacterium]|nr:S41 family peptidase [Gemmataceae bacterium]